MADALRVPRGEAFALFERFKLDPGMHSRGNKVVAEDYSPSFHLETARKDLRLMLEAAGDEPVPLLAALAARMDEAIGRGAGQSDMAVLAKRGV
jgi:3-hydroxyisobutyrate dehydrogenase-like beta-hydroxyacid dehydrogenase